MAKRKRKKSPTLNRVLTERMGVGKFLVVATPRGKLKKSCKVVGIEQDYNKATELMNRIGKRRKLALLSVAYNGRDYVRVVV